LRFAPFAFFAKARTSSWIAMARFAHLAMTIVSLGERVKDHAYD
jgi:hypothetical protein